MTAATALAQHTVQRDELFWRTAYREHGGAVLAYLRGRVGRRDEAEDLLQETFVRAIRAGTFREGGNLRGYLLSVSRNLILNRLRRPRLVVPASDSAGEDNLESVPEESASPERMAAMSAFRTDLERAIGQLPEAHREAFRLGVLEQVPYQEIAERTGWSLSAVKVNVFRARKRLIQDLAQHLPDGV